MALKISAAPRVFKFGATEYPDPMPDATPERCREILAAHNAQFVNASIDGPFRENGKQVYQIKVAAGTKG